MSISLDVIYHLVEDEVYDAYMSGLFDAAERYVIVYSSNKDKAAGVAHVGHRKFTDWVECKRPAFSLTEVIPDRFHYSNEDPKNTSFADFYIFERT